MDNNHLQLKSLPALPGVYQFKNKDDKIIYIGKAKNLRNRVRSYFQNKKHQSAKTIAMMKKRRNKSVSSIEKEVLKELFLK